VRLTNLMEQMARNGDTDSTEEHAVEKFLRCMPKRYAQIVNSIETLLDFKQLTVEDVTGRLKAVQDRKQAPDPEPATVGGKLLYMAEQWHAVEKKEGAGSSKDHRWRPRGGKKNKPKGDCDGGGRQADKAGVVEANRDDTCLNCNHTGRWASDCPHPRQGRAKDLGSARMASHQGPAQRQSPLRPPPRDGPAALPRHAQR
jgi:hypothetical protein